MLVTGASEKRVAATKNAPTQYREVGERRDKQKTECLILPQKMQTYKNSVHKAEFIKGE